jgi:deoxyguanosine kinase
MNVQYNYVVIEGTIGAGKTSLADMLSKEFDASFIPEQFEENSFLPKFYENPEKYAFPLELSFLAERYQQLKEKLVPDLFGQVKIADYFIDKCLIFSRNTLQQDEFSLFRNLFHIIMSQLPQPDLLIYLYKSPEHLKQNILQRGRDYEKNISIEYLSSIQNSYMEYIQHAKLKRVVIVDTSHLDFVHNKNDYSWVKSVVCQEYAEGIHRIHP